MTATQTAPSAAPATTPTAADSAKDVTDDTPVGHNASTPAPIDTDAETALTAEIAELWGAQKDNKASIRQSRAELKALRLALAEKLHAMKQILVRTGRGGGWASYLREQHLPLTTADRLVAEHEAALAPKEEKVPNGGFTVEDARKLAQKMLPKLNGVLSTAELAFGFLDEIFWDLEAAEGRETDDGVEVFRTSHEDAANVENQDAEVASPAPAVS
jgi:hypothetical protein